MRQPQRRRGPIAQPAPISLSSRREDVTFTPEVIANLSPLRHLDRITGPVIVAHGTLESLEFQRQAREFTAALQAAGKPVTLLVGEQYNHFEIIETLANPFSQLGSAMRKLIIAQ